MNVRRFISKRLKLCKQRRIFILVCVFMYILYTFIPVIIVSFLDHNFYIKVVDPKKIFKYEDKVTTATDQNVPVLTLITTFKDVPSRRKVNENTIRCWAGLPQLNPVMYIEADDPPHLAEFGKSHGWKVYNAPRLRHGYPILKDMFLHSLQNVQPKTFFIGYANSDILFTRSLVDTLDYLKSLNGSIIHKRGLFVTGQRINTLLEDIIFNPKTGLLINIDIHDPDKIIRQHPRALDYFIFTRTPFSWNEVHDFVIGKPGYDNWITIRAKEEGLVTIDGSLTINALHQTPNATHTDKGWLSPDVCINGDLVDPYDYGRGCSCCLPYFLQRAKSSFKDYNAPGGLSQKFLMYERQKFPYFCDSYFDLSYSCPDLARKKNIRTETYKINHFS